MAEAGVLAPDERVELIEGAIWRREPQSPEHATAGERLRRALDAAFGPGFVIRPQKPLALGQLSEPEPDVAVVRGSLEDYEDAHPTSAELVVEVADSTLRYDRTEKAALYAAAGIPEYWILNLVDQVVDVHRDPQPDAAAPLGASYAQISRLGRGATLSPLARPGAALKVDDLLRRRG